jgi:plastocyanin
VIPALALVAALGVGSIASAAPSAAAQTINVAVGGGSGGVATNGFFPGTLSIHPGDTVHFANSYEEPHTATFLPTGTAMPALLVPDPKGSPAMGFNPVIANASPASPATFDQTKMIGSGLLLKGSGYDVTFPTGGTFKFLCALHDNMVIAVKVVAAATTADTQATADARAATESKATLDAGNAAVSTLDAKAVSSTKLADGTTNWTVTPGADADVTGSIDVADILHFFPGNVSVKQGDTVTWVNADATPHTVSFLSGAPVPPLITPIVEGSGPPFLALSAQAVLAAGGKTYDGTGFVSSGIFDKTGVPNPSTYSLKFTAAGTFNYVCILHENQGMKGTVTVAASGTTTGGGGTPAVPVTAPSTGTGPAPAGNGAWVPALLALGVVGGLCVLAGTRMIWKQEA